MESTPAAHRAESTSGGRRIALRLQYDGTDFFGWQRQSRGRTVQGVLESILSRLCGDAPVTVIGAGRTDSGVHATAQVAHADVVTRYDDTSLLNAIRRMSPPDLLVEQIATTNGDFHARFHACRRSYRYTILHRSDPFLNRYAWTPGFRFDRSLLDIAAASLLGRHDFTTLSKHNPDTDNPVCEVFEAGWREEGNRLEFRITAYRFLYGMVRLIVGIQLDVARGKLSLEEMRSALAARDRERQSMAVPAHGLALTGVRYPDFAFPPDDPPRS